MRVITAVLLCVCTALGGCDQSPALTMSQHGTGATPVAVPLPPGVRTQIESRIDVRALEEYSGSMAPEERERLLSGMGVVVGARPLETTDVRLPIGSSDPAVQAVLDRVWAPYWTEMEAVARKGGQRFSKAEHTTRPPAENRSSGRPQEVRP